jgi:methionyl-tRNA formyltransferase
MKKRIAIFFNSLRGFKVFNRLKNKFLIDVYLCKKNLNIEIKNKLKNQSYKYKLLNNISPKIINDIIINKYFLIIAAGCPYIFPEKLINASENGTINLHAGPLPKYKGGSPLNWQIINGEKKLGISVIKMTKALDAGPIYSQKKFILKKKDDISHAHAKANYYFPKMTLDTILNIKKKIKPKPQSVNNFKVYKQRNESDGLINWNNLKSEEVVNFVKSITKPYPGAFFYLNGNKTRIFRCKNSKLNPKILPGTVFINKKKKYIKCRINSIMVDI